MEIAVYKNGEKNFSVDYYRTNRNFDELKTAADFIILELQYGRPGIITETHFYDKNIDEKVDLKQEFTKPWGKYSFDDFSREERDKGEKSGVKEFLVHHGQIIAEDGEWVDAPEEQKKAQEEFDSILQKVAEHYVS